MKKKIQLWSLLLAGILFITVGCSTAGTNSSSTVSQVESSASIVEVAGQYTDGTFTGIGVGMGGNLQVSLVVNGGKITKVEVGEHAETPGICEAAIEQIPKAIIAAQSYEVDSVAGATLTSNAIMAGVKNALSGDAPVNQTTQITVEPDVIVVGGGLAGLSAALRASELGAKVVLFEKTAKVGGSGYVAGGSISGTGYKIQKAAGIEDTPDKFFQDFIDMGGGIDNLNEELARKHAERSGEAIDWLQDYVGVEMSDTIDDGSYIPMNTKRVTYTAGGSAAGNAVYFVDALTAKLDEFVQKGTMQIVLNTEVEDIVISTDGNITGVVVDGKEILAPSTILATGGYGYSEEWLKEFAFTNVVSNAISSATGSGYDFARKAGGVFDNMDYCAAYAGAIPVEGFQGVQACSVMYEGAVWVNTKGDRVADEASANSGVRDTVWRTTDQNIVYVLVTESMLKDEVPLFRGMMGSTVTYDNAKTLNELTEKGFVFKADSIDELATMIDTPNLVKTISTYNSDVSLGKDSEFGRIENLVPLDEGPYYAVYTVPYILMTQGGPRIDATGQLLQEDGTKVGNLYLAGEIIGSANLAGHSTIGGIGNGACATWGMISAESAVENAKR